MAAYVSMAVPTHTMIYRQMFCCDLKPLRQDYFLGFFFVLDVVSTASLVLDLTWAPRSAARSSVVLLVVRPGAPISVPSPGSKARRP